MTYLRHRWAVPLGWDSPGYAWRTRIAQATGLGSLPESIPYPGPVNAGRTGFLVVGGVATALAGTDPLRVVAVMPAVMAASAALTWGAVARTVLGMPLGRALIVALFVGTSPFLVHAIGVEGYQDATMALAVFSAAAIPVLIATRTGRAVLPAAVLIGAVGTIHWSFLPVVEAVLGLTALALLPAALRERRADGGSLWWSAPARIVSIGLAGGAIAALWIVVLVPAGLPQAMLVAGQLLEKLRRDLPQLGLWFVIPLAAVGAIWLADDRDRDASGIPQRDIAGARAAFLPFMIAWSEVALLAVAAVWAFGLAVPGHRVLAFCLALPTLAAVGLLWLSDRAAGAKEGGVDGARGATNGVRRWLGVGVIVAGLALSAWWAQRTWLSYHPVMRAAALSEARTAADALDRAGVPAGRPVIFVLDDRGRYAWSRAWITAHTIRAGLPAGRIPNTYFFVGPPADLLAGRSSVLPPGAGSGPNRIDPDTYASLSSAYFAAARPVLRRNPVALILASSNPSFDAWADANPSSVLGPGVAEVEGSLAGVGAMPSRPIEAPSPFAIVGVAVLLVSVISAVGAGWTITLLGRWLDTASTAALAPAMGTAMLALGGILLGRFGLRPNTGGSAAMVVMLALAGLVAPIVSARRARVPGR